MNEPFTEPGTSPAGDAATPDSPRPRRGFARSWKRLATTYVIVMGVLFVGLWAFSVFDMRGNMARQYRGFAEHACKAYRVSEEDTEAILSLVDGALERFESGELEDAESAALLERLGDSPLTAGLVLLPIDEQFIQPSDLSDAEKESFVTARLRIMAALLNDRLEAERVNGLLSDLPRVDGESDRIDFSRQPDVEKLRGFIAGTEELLADVGKSGEDEDMAGDVSSGILREVKRLLGPLQTASI